MRMAHCPEPGPRTRSHNHGPAINDTPLPTANSAITPAPCAALLVIAATNSAEYNSPHGSSAQSSPITPVVARTALPWDGLTRLPVSLRAPAHILRAEFSSQIGWRACTNSIKPNIEAAT